MSALQRSTVKGQKERLNPGFGALQIELACMGDSSEVNASNELHRSHNPDCLLLK